jgi:hypothetical protein
MLASDEAAVRGFCARILGWSAEQTAAIENALDSLRLTTSHRATLVLLGDFDLVPIAQALHRRTVGTERPFVMCDPRRTGHASGVAAFEGARGGSLCVHHRRLPADFPTVVALARDPAASVQLVVCADAHHDVHPFLVLPRPFRVPSLATRASEVPRIVDEYAQDAIERLLAKDADFTRPDREWVIEHASSSLYQIEQSTLRLIAVRQAGSISRAAERIGMSDVALRQWLRKRRRRAQALTAASGRKERTR